MKRKYIEPPYPAKISDIVRFYAQLQAEHGDIVVHQDAGHNNIETYINEEDNWIIQVRDKSAKRNATKEYIFSVRASVDSLEVETTFAKESAEQFTDSKVEVLRKLAALLGYDKIIEAIKL
jgi:hypothetical protein